MNSILVPFDFTPATEKALQQALEIAQTHESRLTLLHICSEKDMLQKQEQLNEVIEKHGKGTGISFKVWVKGGDILEILEQELSNREFTLAVLGTHGPKGLRQFFFGSDILDLVRNSNIPTLVVQEQTQPKAAFRKILMPAGAHQSYLHLAESLLQLAQKSLAEVVLYDIRRPKEDLSDELLSNRKKALDFFDHHEIHCRIVEEPSTAVSFGFAKQTLLFAEQNEFDLIAIVPAASGEYTSIAAAEKERFLSNENGIAIWCA
ncbi:MAG: universal stress protein [Bacteroidia bacterium]|jgi:nucleotide-binding universal stress UspA family protein